MEAHIADSSTVTEYGAMAELYNLMAQSTRVTGLITRWKVKESSNGPVAKHIRGIM